MATLVARISALATAIGQTMKTKADNTQTVLGVSATLATHLANRKIVRVNQFEITQELVSQGKAALQAAVDAFFAKSTGGRYEISTPPGPLNDWPGLNLNGRKKVTWIANGTDYRVNSKPPVSGVLDATYVSPLWIYFNGCEDITFLGTATIDADDIYLPYTMGVVESRNDAAGTFNLRVQGGFRDDMRVCDGHFSMASDGVIGDGANSNAGQSFTITRPSAGLLTCQKIPYALSAIYNVGTRLVLLHKKYGAGIIGGYTNKDIRFLGDYRVYSSSGMGAYFNGSSGTQDLTGFKITFKPNSDRFITTNADGIHFLNQRGGLFRLGEGWMTEGCCDDCVNVHTESHQIASVSGTLITGRVGGRIPGYVQVNDQIQIISPTGQIMGYAYVAALVEQTANNPWSLTVSSVASIPSGMGDGWWVAVLNTTPEKTVIEKAAAVGSNWGNGILAQCRNSFVEWNSIRRVFFRAIIYTSSTFYEEGLLPSFSRVRHNFIDNCARCLTDDVDANICIYNMSPDGSLTAWEDIRNIDVSYNFIRNSPAGGIYLQGIYGISAKANVFEDICQNALGKPVEAPRRNDMTLNNLGNLTLAANSRMDGAGKIMVNGFTLDDVSLSENPGMVIMGAGLRKRGDFQNLNATGTDRASATLLKCSTNRIFGNGGVALPLAATWGARPCVVVSDTPILVYTSGSDYFEVPSVNYHTAPAQGGTMSFIPSRSGAWTRIA
jgi:hypothetical protein